MRMSINQSNRDILFLNNKCCIIMDGILKIVFDNRLI